MLLFLVLVAILAGCSSAQLSPSSVSGINTTDPCNAGILSKSLTAGTGAFYLKYVILFSQADATAISGCTTFEGAINVNPTFPGDLILPKLTNLTCFFNATGTSSQKVSSITSIILPSLTSIGSAFSGAWTDGVSNDQIEIPYIFGVVGLSSITTVWLPSIVTSVAELIILDDLPALSNLSNIQTNPNVDSSGAPSIQITRTGITNITIGNMANFGINGVTSWKNIHVMENPRLVNLWLNTANVTSMNISAPNVEVGSSGISTSGDFLLSGCESFAWDFGSLSTSGPKVQLSSPLYMVNGSLTIHDTALNSIGWQPQSYVRLPSSSDVITYQNVVAKDMIIGNNSQLTSLEPGATAIGGNMVVKNNTNLSFFAVPNLKTVGGYLNITSNPSITNLTFSILSIVSLSVNLQGSFDIVEMPQLTQAWQGFRIVSTSPTFDCSAFDRYYASSVIRGSYLCQRSNTTSSSPTAEPSGLGAAATNDSSLSTGAKAGIGAGVGIVVIALLAIVVFYYLKKRQQSNPAAEPTAAVIPELSRGDNVDRTELDVKENPSELHALHVSEMSVSPAPPITRKKLPEVASLVQHKKHYELP